MKPPEDQVCIDQIKRGDSASYAFLVEKYKDMAYTIALRILRQVEEAEDVAQESFVKAYQQLDQFEGKSKFSTWLYTIVYRTAIHKLGQQRIEMISIDDAPYEKASYRHSETQHEMVQAKDQQKFIRDAIARLPPTESLLITLFYLDENSIKEIMAITGLSESNIKVKLFRAKKQLEEQLRFLL